MISNLFSHSETKNKKKGILVSVLLHLLLLLIILLFPTFSYLDPPPQMQGVLVSFGNPEDYAEDTDEASAAEQDIKELEDVSTKPVEEPIEKQTESVENIDKVENTSPISEVVESKLVDENKIAEFEIAKEKKKKEDAVRKSNEEAALAKKKAADKAKKEAEEKAKKEAEYNKAKSGFGKLFGKGEGKENKSSKGVQDGKPNAKALEGITKGSGRIGGGLKDRGLVYIPEFKDKSQKEGRVVINVCVDSSGKVISAKYTQRGSTTSDRELIKIAIKDSKKYKFSALEIEEQCGSVTIDFKLN